MPHRALEVKIKLELQNITVCYPAARHSEPLVALDQLVLSIQIGEFVSVLGPSGCGKTTLLNAIDGLIPLTAGQILISSKPVRAPGTDRAVVFQTPALLPWRNVIENVVYGLELQGHDRAVAHLYGQQLIKLVGLDGFENHFPAQLSIGMQQRANLARALAINPDVLLLDEPFASLDAQTREQMQTELLRIWASRALQMTAVFVTHDIAEAILLSDRVVVLTPRPGRIRDIVKIDLPRPRDRRMKHRDQFFAYEEQLRGMIDDVANP